MTPDHPAENPLAVDLLRESAIPLSDVPKLPWIPRRRGGRRLNVATVHRWCTHGVRGKRLEHIRLGGTRVTTQAALMRFFHALSNTVASEKSGSGNYCLRGGASGTEGEVGVARK